MIKKEMIKNRLITCSVIVLTLIISGFNIAATNARARGKKAVAFRPRFSAYLFKNIETLNDFSFANEALPVNNAGVYRKLMRSLTKRGVGDEESNILHGKAEKLFPILEPILRAYGIPDDFKYIPLVESGLSGGISPKGARGIWQFMPGTARTYGLKVGHGRDERLNFRKSSIAACKYIKELYAEFNSWTLTAAAYNNGSVKLQRAIRHQNEDDYFRMRLNRETGAYVYNLIAMKALIGQPKNQGNGRYNIDYYSLSSAELLAHN